MTGFTASFDSQSHSLFPPRIPIVYYAVQTFLYISSHFFQNISTPLCETIVVAIIIAPPFAKCKGTVADVGHDTKIKRPFRPTTRLTEYRFQSIVAVLHAHLFCQTRRGGWRDADLTAAAVGGPSPCIISGIQAFGRVASLVLTTMLIPTSRLFEKGNRYALKLLFGNDFFPYSVTWLTRSPDTRAVYSLAHQLPSQLCLMLLPSSFPPRFLACLNLIFIKCVDLSWCVFKQSSVLSTFPVVPLPYPSPNRMQGCLAFFFLSFSSHTAPLHKTHTHTYT